MEVQLEGLMEKQAANTVLLEDAIQRLYALERKFDEQRPQKDKEGAQRGHCGNEGAFTIRKTTHINMIHKLE
ncbi:hypothetical protein R3I93_004862 [Phoxinus phoxinus]|uniref:Uncharacterized protein n=1 Tax=Phoxinus phoxinus TaxID=58324 RepID=A0AAN9DCP5_9TELE